MRSLFLPLIPGLFVSATSAAEPGDVATLKKMLATASAWSSSGNKLTAFDPATRQQLEDLAGKVADPDLRAQARKLVNVLEPACVLHARVRFLLAEIKRLKGKSVTEPGGPEWLRKLVGAEAMTVFTRLTEIELN